MKDKIQAVFTEIFGSSHGAEVFFAPGRVNLIGEHTDYNGGHVFPCALTIGTYAAAEKRTDNKLKLYSANFEDKGIIEVSIDELIYDKADDWANYPKGVIKILKDAGYKIDCGMNIAYIGNIPNSSGLSSSASIEVLTGFIAKELFGLDVDMINIAKLSQKAENEFIGVNCGIMDQFAIAMGKKDNAIFLDTATLEYEYAPVVLKDSKIVITCSNKKRGLGDSKYNERRSECEAALAQLQTVKSVNSLGELSVAEFDSISSVIDDEVKRRRAKHAVCENERTIEAVKALKADDITRFGLLMNASHESLKYDYEVTGIELDTLVEASWKQEGVIGSRMTGAGFGGCTVSIVKNECLDAFIDNVGKKYEETIGYKADFYVVEVGSGPCRL